MNTINDIIIRLCKEDCDYHFFSVAWGTSSSREMVVRWLFRDSKFNKNYLVFTPVDDMTEKHLREYFGDYREERYIRISEKQIVHSINAFLKEIDT